jgi:hypothetical protein
MTHVARGEDNTTHIGRATALLHDLQACVDKHNQELRDEVYLALCGIAMRLHGQLQEAEEERLRSSAATPAMSGRRPRRAEVDWGDEGTARSVRREDVSMVERRVGSDFGTRRGASWVL